MYASTSNGYCRILFNFVPSLFIECDEDIVSELEPSSESELSSSESEGIALYPVLVVGTRFTSIGQMTVLNFLFLESVCIIEEVRIMKALM